MGQKAEIVKQQFIHNIELQRKSLDKNMKLLEEAQSNGEIRKVQVYANRVKGIEKRIILLQNQLKYIRDDTPKDLAEREEVRKTFSKQVSEIVPDGVPMVFHGNNDISTVYDIIKSGGLKTPEEQGIDFKSFATQIDVANKFDIHVPVEFAEPGYQSCRPYGAIFVFYPAEDELDKGLNNYGSEVPGGVKSIDFKEDRFVGIITTEENKQRIQEWLEEFKIDSNKVFTHSEFIQMCIIRPQNAQQSFRESIRFDVSSNEYAQETLKKFTNDLENGTLDEEDSKKKEDYNPDKTDDDYVM